MLPHVIPASLMRHDARDLLAAYPDREEIVAMMTPLTSCLSWMISLHARREALSASTWL